MWCRGSPAPKPCAAHGAGLRAGGAREKTLRPRAQDGANTNNVVTVLPRGGDDMAARERLLSPSGTLTEEERSELAQLLCPWGSHDRAMHRPRAGAPAAASADGV